MSDYLKTKVMEFMAYHRGRENAVPRRELHFHLHRFVPEMKDRAMRKLYEGLPLASCKAGLFVPLTPREADEFKGLCERKAKKILVKYATLVAYYPNLKTGAPGEAPLFNGMGAGA